MINDQNQKHIVQGFTALAVVATAFFFSFVLEHLGSLALLLEKIVEILMPFICGMVMALLMAPICQTLSVFITKCLRPGGLQEPTEVRIDKHVLVKFRGSSSARLLTEAGWLRKEKSAERIGKIAIILTCIIVILAVLAALIVTLIPQLIGGVSDLTSNLPRDTNSINDWIQVPLHDRNPDMEQMILEGYRQISGSLMQWVSVDLVPNLNKYLTQITGGMMRLFVFLRNFFIGLIVMAYGLNIRETLAAQSKCSPFVLLSRRAANDTVTELRYIKWAFSSFIIGKIIDSMIIGIICYIYMSLMKMPYALLISVFVGVANVIPSFGPFVGAVPNVFILLMVSSIMTLQLLTSILVLQQFDGNTLGPRTLGSTTDMSSFWVLFTALLFGGIWGTVGMVVDIPTFVVSTRLTERALANVLKKKKLPVKEGCYDTLDYIDTGDGSLHYGRRDKKR